MSADQTYPAATGNHNLPANDIGDWPTYWVEHGQPGRIRPEIPLQRQQELAACLQKSGGYPFQGQRLDRADVEWLLANYEPQVVQVQRLISLRREQGQGLDLRGACLEEPSDNRLGFGRLNLGELRGGIEGEPPFGTSQEREEAAIHAKNAIFFRVNLEEAQLRYAHLEGADLRYAHLEGATLRGAHLDGADLRYAFFDSTTTLDDIKLSNKTRLAGIRWSDANISVVDWSQIDKLGDECAAWESRDENTQIVEFETAVRANRQLAVQLQAQGLNEEAAHFAYRAQVLQRQVLRYQKKGAAYIFSRCLDMLAGYGYKPWKSLRAYVLTIISFMALYLLNSHYVTPHLRWDEALVLSVSSFHGRGFFNQRITLGDTYARLSAFEAFIGLIIEATFIATLTQRFFGK